MSSAPAEVLVVGAGITGLSACYELRRQRPDLSITLVESRSRLGGNVHTEHESGFLLDGGPDSFLRTKPETAELCGELGLGGELISPHPSAHRVFVASRGELVPMPAGMALAVPTRVLPLLRSPLLSPWGKLRVLGDWWVAPRAADAPEETVASFLTRHFGEQATRRLAGPLLGGIFAGDIDELSIEATFPQLVELERSAGSLVRAFFGAERARAAREEGRRVPRPSEPLELEEYGILWRWLRREGAAPASPFQSLRRGIGSLVDRLVEELTTLQIWLETRLVGLQQLPSGRWLAGFDAGRPAAEFDAVLLCLPAHALGPILNATPQQRALAEMPYVSTTTVFFGFPTANLPQPLVGAGFICPRDEGSLLASTWVSSKWEHRAPGDMTLVRGFLGGAREPDRVANSTDEELTSLARKELERYLGPLGSVHVTRVFRWMKANPQPVVGHGARVAAARATLPPGLWLAGSGYEAVGLSECIRQGRSAARQAVMLVEQYLSPSSTTGP